MARDSVTLALSGEVTSSLFAQATHHFDGLIRALSTDIAEGYAFEWLVDEAPPGGTATTLRGEPRAEQDVDRIDRVVRAYTTVGHALQVREPIGYSEKVVKEAHGLAALLNGRIKAIRFETGYADATILSQSVEHAKMQPLQSFGAIEGRVQTATSRRRLQFVLYDALYDRGVNCYLNDDPEAEEMVRGVWGRRAIVEGIISRDPISGRPLAIRRITDVRVLDDVEPGTYRRARAILPYDPTIPTPEERIRQVRDAR